MPNYLAYVLYSPLYLAGPIITFNYYISQVLCPRTIGDLIVVAIPFCDDFHQTDGFIWIEVFICVVDDGNHSPFYLRRRDFQNSCLGGFIPFPTQYDKLL